MRKSTLITTIAMIVVVVVALSTATYAWFTTSSQVAANASISTTSSSEWQVQHGTISTTATLGAKPAITFTSPADDITLNALLANGLWSPKAAIGIFTENTASTGNTITTTDIPGWIQGQHDQDSGNDWKTSDIVAKADSTYANSPDILRVTNSKDGSRNLVCNIIIKLGANPSDAVKVAAAATTFYLGVRTGTTTKAYTNGYNYLSAADANVSINSTYGETFVIESGADDKVGKTEGITGDRPSDALIHTFSTIPSTNPPAWNEFAKCATGDAYLLYSINLGSFNTGNSATMVVYTWLDGWNTPNDALGAKLTISYVFTTGA